MLQAVIILGAGLILAVTVILIIKMLKNQKFKFIFKIGSEKRQLKVEVDTTKQDS